MIVSAPLIDRLGFENYAFNLFVNVIEDGDLRNDFTYEQSDLSLVIKLTGNEYMVAIRCYHPNRGWMTVDFTYKSPTQK